MTPDGYTAAPPGGRDGGADARRDQDSAAFAVTLPQEIQIVVEQPVAGAVLAAGETVLGHGWVLAPSPVRAVSVEVDGMQVGDGVTGLARADIAAMHQDHPHGARAGFAFLGRLPSHAAGACDLMFSVRTDSGWHRHLVPIVVSERAGDPPSTRGAEAPPAGEQAMRIMLEEARVEPGGLLYVRGWALSDCAISKVDVLLGTDPIGVTEANVSRDDVAAAFPAYAHAATSGFALCVALPPGIEVTADASGQTATAVLFTSNRAAIKDAPAAEHADEVDARDQVTPDGLPEEFYRASEVVSPPPAVVPGLPPMQVTVEEARVNDQGVLRVRGWAVSLSPVQQIRVMVDGRLLGLAAQNLPREDVGLAHPDYHGSANGGFLLQVEVDEQDYLGQQVSVAVVALGGIHREVSAPVVVAPLVRRRAVRDTDVHFHCDAISLTDAGALYVKGWAVCASGVAAIDVELGDEPIGRAEPGEERADVGNHFPQIGSARSSGFRFVGQAPRRCEGEHIVRLTVHGHGGESRVILQPVLARPDETAPTTQVTSSESIRFYLDSPAVVDGRVAEPVRGFLSLSGWAFSSAGVCGIEVFVDGRSLGKAYHGIRREDLADTFGRAEALRSGFGMLVPPQAMRRGPHDIRVVIRDNAGQIEDIRFAIVAEPSIEGAGPWALRRKLPRAEIDLQIATLTAAGASCDWTLLLPIGARTPANLRQARATLDSMRHQAYPRWRIVLPVNSESEGEALLATLLPGLEDLAERVEFVVADPASSLADLLPATTQEQAMLCLLSPGDQLGEDALLEFSVEAALHREADFLYSDERRVDPSDATRRAFFKPDWSPDLLLSTNYIGRPWAASKALLQRIDARLEDIGLRGNYDLVLRLTEQATGIRHVAKVLCERGGRFLDNAATERRALHSALRRRGVAGEVSNGCLQGTYRIHRAMAGDPLVSIIIPTIASRGLVKVAIESIRSKTTYRNFEIICLDNIPANADAEALAWKDWLRGAADRVVEIAEAFNWSRFNNIGADAASGSMLLFLNDDIEVQDGAWLGELVAQALRPEVGAVGPQLLYPDGKVQHAGMFLSGSVGRHAFRFSPRDEPGPFGLALTQRDVIAVTGACLMTRRDVFDALGGFDERHSVINNDLDFCLRAGRAGHAVIYTPHVTLTHHEMVSRAEIKDIFNAAHFEAEWRDLLLSGDPFFNPNLARDVEDYVPEQEPVRLLYVGHPIVRREDVRRILALKVDHIGDFVSAFPALRRIKKHFPNAELTVLAAKASLSLAALEPAIDRVIRFDFFHARSERGRRETAKKELQRLAEELAPYRFDLAMDLRRQPDTRPILRHTGARWLAGFDQGNGTDWLDIAVEWEGDIARVNKRTHVSDALVQFVDAVSVACESERRTTVTPRQARDAKRALQELPDIAALGADLFARRLVCVHVGAGADNKRWPTANFAGLLDLLMARDNVNAVLIGGPDEAELRDALLGMVREPSRLFSLVGKLPLQHLPNLVQACDLYVGNDSGPKHLAASLGVPTLGIHGGSVDATEWGPMGPAAVGIRRATACSPCYIAKVSDCPRNLACLHGIAVADVYHACQRLLTLSRIAVSENTVGHIPTATGYRAVPARSTPSLAVRAGRMFSSARQNVPSHSG